MTVVIGTAGHIDHGKTALLRALTGINADRLPEERRRGMTIDVGYAHLRLPDGTDLDFVDVPGHDRLIGNMLVGAGEVDAILLVVAADDGPRAQTLEHLGLLDGLRIGHGVVALTKVDAVEPGRVDEVSGLVRTMLRGTSLEGSPIVPVSSIDGRGLADLAAALTDLRDRVRANVAEQAAADPVRLSIDRSFLIKGRGAVVTGSLRGGRLDRGALLRLVPGERLVRARELQVHGNVVESLTGGGRIAINLAAIEPRDLPRGAVLTTDPGVRASTTVIAVLEPVAGPDQPVGLNPGADVRLHLGTEQVQATLGRGRVDLVPLPGGGAIARLRLARPIAVAAGDRFVLRHGSAGRRVIGGRIADPDPPVGPSRRRLDPGLMAGLVSTEPLGQARALLALHGILEPSRLVGDTGAGLDPADDPALGAIRLAGILVVAPIAAALASEALKSVADRVATAGVGSLSLAELRSGLSRLLRRLATVDERRAGAIVDALLAGLVADRRLERTGDRVHEPGRSAAVSTILLAAMDRLERALSNPAPPSVAEASRASGCSPEGVRALEAAGRIVRLDGDLAYAAATYRELAATAIQMAQVGALTPAAYRDATGTSRKYVMAILEDLDRRGVLRRVPAGHLPGPRPTAVDEIGRSG